MNVYDFDKTIYDGDSTLDFYLFCIKRHPFLLLKLPLQIKGYLQYKTGKYSKTQFKEQFYIFLKQIRQIDNELKLFWDKNENKIKEFYRQMRQPDDMIISASPVFLLQPICDRLQIKNLIASQVDKKTGNYTGENCYGEEKVSRLKKFFDQQEIKVDTFYSDSYSDEPLAKLAKEAFLVKGNHILPWGENK